MILRLLSLSDSVNAYNGQLSNIDQA